MAGNVEAGDAVNGSQQDAARSNALAWISLVFAVAALAGSLALSLGLSLKPCALCYYQRAFAMSLVAVLAIGLLAGAARPGRLALPIAVAGLGVALFHVSLELRGKLECPAGLLNLGTAPQQSLGMFSVLTVLLFLDAAPGTGMRHWTGVIGAIVIGALLAVASCIANPPPPPPHPYEGPPDICRPPYHPGS